MRSARMSIVALLCLAPLAAGAAEHAALHYSKGLVQFHQGRYAEALADFDRAVATDPADANALYYRGVTHGRLGSWDAAIADLGIVVESAPQIEQAPLDLGIALLYAGRPEQALVWLDKARRHEQTASEASLYAAIAHLRLDQPEPAVALLQPLPATDPQLAVSAHYYLGVAQYRAGRHGDALSHFDWVVVNAPGSTMAAEAARFCDRLAAAPAARPYRVWGHFGLAYDSNVFLAPDGMPIEITESDESDGRSELTLGGEYTAYRSENLWLFVGYEFFQSLHFDLDEFDLQDHRLSAQVVWQRDRIAAGLLTRYDYYLIEGDESFLAQGTALPWMTISEGDFGRTELSYRYRPRDYRKRALADLLEGDNHRIGIRQLKYLGSPRRYVALGYEYDLDDPHKADDDAFAYDGHELSAGFAWDLAWELDFDAEYSYRHERYDGDSRRLDASGDRRDDDEHRVIGVLSRPLTEHFTLVGSYVGIFNESSNAVFEYDRHIGSLTLEARL